jgi:hypothetical protein
VFRVNEFALVHHLGGSGPAVGVCVEGRGEAQGGVEQEVLRHRAGGGQHTLLRHVAHHAPPL